MWTGTLSMPTCAKEFSMMYADCFKDWVGMWKSTPSIVSSPKAPICITLMFFNFGLSKDKTSDHILYSFA
jgi:hypothetical protein